MCGIAGQIGRDPRVIQGQYAAYCAMQQTLSRRGPDQRGMFISGRAALIHARLAVVDIENGLQPMQLDWQGESYTLVYNGELYNTPELRAALQNKGHSFTGHSDTEVLLHAFAQWGAGCLERCNGIFAFAVWAQRAGTLFLARDRWPTRLCRPGWTPTAWPKCCCLVPAARRGAGCSKISGSCCPASAPCMRLTPAA